MSKKRTRMDTPFKTNIMEVTMDDKDYDDQTLVKIFFLLFFNYEKRKRKITNYKRFIQENLSI